MSVTFWQAPSMKKSSTIHTEINVKQIEHPIKSPFPCERSNSMIKVVGQKEMTSRTSVRDLASDVYNAATAEKETKMKKPQSELTILVNALITYFRGVKERKRGMKKTCIGRVGQQDRYMIHVENIEQYVSEYARHTVHLSTDQ